MIMELPRSHSAGVRITPLVLLACSALCATAVTASAATLCVSATAKGCNTTISAAVAAANPGDVIRIAGGTYREQVTITTSSISLMGDPANQPVINAAGKNNGIFVNGMATAPLPGIANVVISGLRVENANFEGILIANATNITLTGNHVIGNNKALNITTGECPGIPAFETNEGDDCGEGIHLMAVDHSNIIGNITENNSGGMLSSDETGPTTDNLIQGNIVRDNQWDCGITLASHGPATSVIASAKLPFGLARNVISGNISYHNGTSLPGAGAGVGIFAPFPGTSNTANVVIGNTIYDNGLPGVTMHNHASVPPPAPGINLNDNVIVGNHIYGNAADTDDAFTAGPTGINIYSTAPVYGTVISQNNFSEEAIDINFNAPGGQINAHFNNFNQPGVIGLETGGAGTIDATSNWYHCSTGPSASCVTASGSGITTIPWLTAPWSAATPAW